MRKLSLTLVPLLFLACGREPVGPTAPVFGATSDWTGASLFLSNAFYVPCLDDTVRFSGEVPYTLHEVASAAGPSGYTLRFIPVTPLTPQFSAVALTSGRTFWYQYGLPYNETFRLVPGQVLNLKWHEVYRAEVGRDRLYNDGTIHLTINAGGVLVVDRREILGVRCERK